MKLLLTPIAAAGWILFSIAQFGGSRAATVLSGTERMAPMVLNGYSHFPRDLGKAVVYDMDGKRIGPIERFTADPTGKPSSLEVWLPSARTVTVQASNIGYDEQGNVVIIGIPSNAAASPTGPQ